MEDKLNNGKDWYEVRTAQSCDLAMCQEIKELITKKFGIYVEIRNEEGEEV